MKNFYSDKKVLVTGGSGFIGSFLVDRLVDYGANVVVVDNFMTGEKQNLKKYVNEGVVELIEADVVTGVDSYLDQDYDMIFHMASPASPRGFEDAPLDTYPVNSFGTDILAKYAHKKRIPLLFASTSEAYGNPKEHPQKEEYWGYVNPVGVRSCYDVSKRFGEMVLSTYHRKFNSPFKIVRIFNTYGPRMDPKDGRVMPNFITQALSGKPITVHGDGTQTRSFCYVTDLVEFILRNMATDELNGQPVNIGNPHEITMIDLAKMVKELTSSDSEIAFIERPEDDPEVRRPDISLAKKVLHYEPKIGLEEGLIKTIEFFAGKAM